LGLVLAAGGAAAEPLDLRVLRTLGDASETTCLAVEGDALWVGTLGAGVFRLRGEAAERFDSARGLRGSRVRDCALVAGGLWAATDAGLARFDAAGKRFVRERSGGFVKLAVARAALLTARADGGLLVLQPGQPPRAIASGIVASALAISD